MKNPNQSFFFKLIKRNKGQNITSSQNCLKINGLDSEDCNEQRKAFALYYEDLAAPKTSEIFEDKYLANCRHRCNLTENLAVLKKQYIQPFSIEEISEAIKTLNTNKAADEYGISAEHIKYGQDALLTTLLYLYNCILETGIIPETFKTGYITPVHKKGKDEKWMENYRGISVASIFGKIFEKLLLMRLKNIDSNQ